MRLRFLRRSRTKMYHPAIHHTPHRRVEEVADGARRSVRLYWISVPLCSPSRWQYNYNFIQALTAFNCLYFLSTIQIISACRLQVVSNSTHLKNCQLTLTKVTYSSNIRRYTTFQNYLHDIVRVVPSSLIVPKACWLCRLYRLISNF